MAAESAGLKQKKHRKLAITRKLVRKSHIGGSKNLFDTFYTTYALYFFTARTALCPPKPKEFDMAALTVIFLALPGT